MEKDVTVLPGDDPKNLRLNWVIYEETGPYYLPSESTEHLDTDEADKFKDKCGKDLKKFDRRGFSVVPVLDFLWGKPWNNLALNYVHGLSPTHLRVCKDSVTADAYKGRVTVYLEKDERTIKRIDMEMDVGLIGCDSGYDLQLKTREQETGRKIEPFDVCAPIMNVDAVSRAKIEK